MKRIGLLTSGGDCQGLNTALRGVAKSLYEYFPDLELAGFRDGFRGLVEKDYKIMQPQDFSGILTVGGTILGTSRMPFKQVLKPIDPLDPGSPSRLDAMCRTCDEMEIDSLVMLGGNGSHKTANLLSEKGIKIITLPKTIDNDLWGTDMTFGFQSAVAIATAVIDSIHTTATSHGRVFIIELMGHRAGWLTLHAGLAGGADVILIPEIPFSMENIVKALERRQQQKKSFSIITIAEGASCQPDSPKKSRSKIAGKPAPAFPSIAYRLAYDLGKIMKQEIRVTVPGHYQRGGQPCAYDRVLATILGTAAAALIYEGQHGCMAGIQNGSIVPVPLKEVAGRLKLVPDDSMLVRSARSMGLSFG